MAQRNYNNYQRKTKHVRESPIPHVSIDGLVVLKIIKHAEEGNATNSDVEGVLLGMLTDNQLEITNCFPVPKNEDENSEDGEYHGKMVRHMRNANVDHLYVGWYQVNPYGSTLYKFPTIESQYYNQNLIAESIFLMYDPVRSKNGYLSLKAYRLTNAAMKLKKDNQFTQAALNAAGMSFTKFYEEIPVKIRNSHLVCGLMCELDEHLQPDEGKQLLDLGSINNLEKSMQSLMKCVDKFAITQKQNIMRQYQVQRENNARAERGEAPLTEEEISRMFKGPSSADDRLNQILHYSQTLNYCKEVSSYSTQIIGKLYLSKALDSN